MAFWKYDQFPYCSWGEIDEIRNDKVYIKSYQGWFKPFLITDYESGIATIVKLDKIQVLRRRELLAIQEKYDLELKSIIIVDKN